MFLRYHGNMKNDSGEKLKRRGGRKYQFDPQDISCKYHMVESAVRQRVQLDREMLRNEFEPELRNRRELFKTMLELKEKFIPPDSKDELDTRALSLNSQIILRNIMLNYLSSMASGVERTKHILEEKQGRTLSAKPITTIEEQAEEIEAYNALKKIREAKFTEELMKKSRIVIQEREKELQEKIAIHKLRDEEEAMESRQTLIASDRIMLMSGAYRTNPKSQ